MTLDADQRERAAGTALGGMDGLMEQDWPGDPQLLHERGDFKQLLVREKAAVGLAWRLTHLDAEAMAQQGLLQRDEAIRHGRAGGQQQGRQQEQASGIPHRSAVKGVAQRCRVSLLNGGSQCWIRACSRPRRALVVRGTSLQKRMLSWWAMPQRCRASP